MNRLVTIVSLFGGSLAYGADPPFSLKPPPPAPIRWEYKAVRASQLSPPVREGGEPSVKGSGLEDALNKLGEDGWELVAVEPQERAAPASGQPTTSGTRRPPAEQIELFWNAVSKGKDTVDTNAPDHRTFKERMIERGMPIPKDGIVTKEQFIAGYKERPSGSTYYFKRPKR